MCIKVSQEIEQEYINAQNRTQQMLYRKLIDLRPAYQQEDMYMDSRSHRKQSLMQSASYNRSSEVAASSDKQLWSAGNVEATISQMC